MRPNQQAIDYAQARYFCLFLQERGLLEPFYRKFRLAVAGDPTGLRTLRALIRRERIWLRSTNSFAIGCGRSSDTHQRGSRPDPQQATESGEAKRSSASRYARGMSLRRAAVDSASGSDSPAPQLAEQEFVATAGERASSALLRGTSDRESEREIRRA